MSVYVDDMRAPYGRMTMCHMVADTPKELLAMADRIGVARRWIQKPGTVHEHFDISLGKRRMAIAAGALEITKRELGRIFASRRLAAKVAVEAPAVQAVQHKDGALSWYQLVDARRGTP